MQRGVAEVAAALLDRLDELADGAVARIMEQEDGYGENRPVAAADLRASCRDNLRFMFQHLVEGDVLDLSQPRRIGRRRAEQGLPLATVQNAYRVGFGFLWESVVTQAQRSGALDDAALVRLATRVWGLSDRYTAAVSTAYRDTLAEHMIVRDQERSALVEAVLEGRLAETTLWEAAELLSLPYQGSLTVVAAEALTLARAVLPNIENRLQARGISSAWRLLPDLHVGIVSLRAPAVLDELLGVLRPVATGRIGVSPLFARLDETPPALNLARIALLSSPEGTAQVNVFDDAPLPVLVISTPTTAFQITNAVLGPVLELAKEERSTLLDTLEAWFAAGGSAAGAAKRIFVHPNTVRHRLRRLEEHTKRRLADPKDSAELYVALEALKRLPDRH